MNDDESIKNNQDNKLLTTNNNTNDVIENKDNTDILNPLKSKSQTQEQIQNLSQSITQLSIQQSNISQNQSQITSQSNQQSIQNQQLQHPSQSPHLSPLPNTTSSPENEVLSLSQPNIEPVFSDFVPFTREEEQNATFENNLMEINNRIISLINTEKKKIKAKREEFEQLKSEFLTYKKTEMQNLEKEKEKLKNLFVLKNGAKEDDILELNIGGTHEVSTMRNTLIKYKSSSLAALFNGDPLTEFNGKIFLDRDGNTFLNLLKFLRTGKLPYFENNIEKSNFFTELNFWKIKYDESLFETNNKDN